MATDDLNRYDLTKKVGRKLFRKFVWVDQPGEDYVLMEVTVVYDPSPFKTRDPLCAEPRYMYEAPIRFRDASGANDAADRLFAELIIRGWQQESKHKQQ